MEPAPSYFGLIQGNMPGVWWNMDKKENIVLNSLIGQIRSMLIDEGAVPLVVPYTLEKRGTTIKYEMFSRDWWDPNVNHTQGYHPGTQIFRKCVNGGDPRHVFVFKPTTDGLHIHTL